MSSIVAATVPLDEMMDESMLGRYCVALYDAGLRLVRLIPNSSPDGE